MERRSRCTPACCRRTLAGARSPVRASSLPDDVVLRDEVRFAALRGDRLGDRHADRPADRVDDHHRALGGPAEPRVERAEEVPRLGVRRSGRRVDGVARHPVHRPRGEHHPGTLRGGLGQLVGRRDVTGVDDHPEPPALGLEPADQLDQPLATAPPATPPPGRHPRARRLRRGAPSGPGARRRGPPRARRDRRRRRTPPGPTRGAGRRGRRARARGRRPRAPTRAHRCTTRSGCGRRAPGTAGCTARRAGPVQARPPPACDRQPGRRSAPGSSRPHRTRRRRAPTRPGPHRPSSPAAPPGSRSPRPGPRPGWTGTARC